MNSKSEKGKEGKKSQSTLSPKKQASSKAKENFEEEKLDKDLTDEWEKPATDEFDSDLEEFDPPKAKSKSGKSKSRSVDEFDLDEDFRDMGFFNDSTYDDDDDDDLF